MRKINDFFKKKTSRIMMFIILDIFALALASIISVWMRFDFKTIPHTYFLNSYQFLIIDVLIMLLVFHAFKLYRFVWSYASIIEMMNIIGACMTTEAFYYIYKHLIFNIKLPRSTYLIELLLLIIFISAIRYSYRIFKSFILSFETKMNKRSTMIIGAGEAGRLLIDEMLRNQKLYNTKIECIIDDDPQKNGVFLRGIPIVGTRRNIVTMAERYEIQDIIIAIPSATKETISEIVEECQKTDCQIKILPSIYLSINENGTTNLASTIRPISYEDFLGRNQIIVDNEEIELNIKDKVILVTGGGGSIGSELCRQIAKCEPKTLAIFDIYENNAYDIQQELFRDYPQLDLRTIIGSVRDYDRLEKVFQELKPNQVYHAAAHKHVPLMEVSPNEAIKNNCLGTLNACKLADKYKVEKFVLISTDKAVRPTNVMGASKRICEMIMQTYDKMSKNTDYVAVRFGNVLGSNGSVIPLFLKQIENGGPVTVTHKKIRRYFMTIPEAVSLVLQAGCYATGGEIFVLDMGEPVYIYELAEKLIRYKGYEPNVDIKIEITGLRPGEKLYEEMLMEEEGLKETPNKLIHIGKPLKIEKDFLDKLDKLIKEAYENRNDIKDEVAKIVTTYTIDKERVGK